MMYLVINSDKLPKYSFATVTSFLTFLLRNDNVAIEVMLFPITP